MGRKLSLDEPTPGDGEVWRHGVILKRSAPVDEADRLARLAEYKLRYADGERLFEPGAAPPLDARVVI